MKGKPHGPTPTVQLVVGGQPAGRVIPVAGPRLTIGRDEACQLRPHSASWSAAGASS